MAGGRPELRRRGAAPALGRGDVTGVAGSRCDSDADVRRKDHDAAPDSVNFAHGCLQDAGPAIVLLPENVLQDIERVHPHVLDPRIVQE